MLYVFGGYLNGLKSNIFFKMDLNEKTMQILTPNTPENHRQARNVPCQRTSSRIVYSQTKNSIYLFGGLNMNNDTLSDMWRFDLEESRWYKIK